MWCFDVMFYSLLKYRYLDMLVKDRKLLMLRSVSARSAGGDALSVFRRWSLVFLSSPEALVGLATSWEYVLVLWRLITHSLTNKNNIKNIFSFSFSVFCLQVPCDQIWAVEDILVTFFWLSLRSTTFSGVLQESESPEIVGWRRPPSWLWAWWNTEPGTPICSWWHH